MNTLTVTYASGLWAVRKQLYIKSVVELSQTAIAVRRLDDAVSTFDLRDREWKLAGNPALEN
jgi:hypothetical protein